MTPAQFKSTRELLGLSAQWLSARLGVSLRTIQRFEDGSQPIPAGIADELLAIGEAIALAVEGYVEFFGDKPGATLEVPRRDDQAVGGLPATAHRAIAARVRLTLPDLSLDYI